MRSHPFLLLICCSVFFSACQTPEEKVTRNEALQFANRLHFTMERRNTAMIDSVFSEKDLGEKISEKAGVGSQSFIKGVMEGLRNRQLGAEMIKAMGADGSYEMVRQYEKEGRQHVIFRLYGEDGLNYHDYELVKNGGRVKAADIYMYTTGENISESLANTLIAFNEMSDQGNDKNAIKTADAMKTIRRLMNQGKFEEARSLYDAMPAHLKKMKMFMVLNIQICAQVGQDPYKAALNALATAYPDDPTAQLMMIDAHFLSGNYEGAMNAVNSLDRSVEMDPLLDYYRSLIFRQMKEEDSSFFYLRRLCEKKPDFGNGVLELIAAYAAKGDYKNAAPLVAQYRANKKFNQQKLEWLSFSFPKLAGMTAVK